MPGISPQLPLNRDPVDGYALNKTLKAALRQNLKMLVLTSPGERMMLPDFGVGIRRYLFEDATAQTFSNIKSNIREQTRKYIPQIQIQSVQFLSEYSGKDSLEGTSSSNYVSLRIEYSIRGYGQDTLSIGL